MQILAPRRRRFTPLALAAGVLGSAVLGLGATGTFSALTAQINNTANSAGAGSIVMEETDSSGTQSGRCISTAGTSNVYSCTTFNKYGGSTTLKPGDSVNAANYPQMTIRIYNTGSVDASAFTLKPLGCTHTNPNGTSGDVCAKLRVGLTCTVTTGGSSAAAVTVYDGTLANSNLNQIAGTAVDLKTAKACTPAKTTSGGNSYTTFAFSVTLDPGADANVMGQVATQELDWQFTA